MTLPEFNGITHNPDFLDGKPCIRHLPVSAATVLTMLASGRTESEILQTNPMLRPEDIKSVLAYAAWRINETAAMEPPARSVGEKPPEKPAGATTEAGPSPIVLTRAGVFDRRLGLGIIAWHDIEKLAIVGKDKNATVELELVKPYRYLSRLPKLQCRLAEFKLVLRIPPFRLRTEGTGLSVEALHANLQRAWLMFRNDKWAPPRDIPEFSSLLQNATRGEPPAGNE